ncbi:MAG: hypothetical protein J6Y80_05320, partial [Victivallales bacterium]|nr:hypothetical protein [Victivallales bacterium]
MLIGYSCPRAWNDGKATFNKWHTEGNTVTPLAESKDPAYNTGFDTQIISWHSAADEQAGIYWQWDVPGTDGWKGFLSPIWVAESFGPVFAWDGAPAIPVAAVAWRTTPYNKYTESAGAENIYSYEFVDVYFSERLGLVEDRGLYNGSNQISGWAGQDYTMLNHGPCGADLLNATTVRFKLNSTANNALDLSFQGAIYPMSGTGIEHAWSANSYSPEFAQFDMSAAGFLPLCSAYQVTGGPSDKIPVFQITNPTATITTKVVQAISPSEEAHTVTDGTTFTYTAKPKSIDNSGNTAEIDGFFLLGNGGGFNNAQVDFTWEDDYSMGYVAAKNGANIPGASYYAEVTKALVRNTTIEGYGFDYSATAAIQPWAVFNAPAPNAWVRWAQNTGRTPGSGILSGPVYNFMNASAMVIDNTSRINDGEDYAVLGIDAAGSGKLTAVKVRFVSTGYGQFDPAVDLLPLSDGASSGVYLYDENNGAIVKIATDGLEWSDWGINAYGQPYRETTLRSLSGAALPAAGGEANSIDFTVHIVPSSEFNLGDSFYVEIPADGLVMGNQSSRDSYTETWTTTDGTQGYPLSSFQYLDINGDYRWSIGEPIADAEDVPPFVAPFYDGGRPYSLRATMTSKHVLWQNGLESRNLYYAKKNGATFATTNRYKGYYDIASIIGRATHKTGTELFSHVNYEPGDDVWFDIGGRPGVYDAGVDIPLFGNADKFVLPWANKQAGAKSAFFHGAPHSEAHSVTSGVISAPSGEPIAIVGLNMEDTGRGFGPRYLLNGAVLVESVSKNLAPGEFELAYTADGSLAFAGGAAVAIPAEVGERAILVDADGTGFIVIRRMADLYDEDEDGDMDETVELPVEDETVAFGVSEDLDRDIQQPQAITGVRVIAVGNGNVAGTATLTRNGTKLAWNGGAAVNVADGGIFVLKGKAADGQDYLTVQVTMVGGATSEELTVYQADGQPITPFQNITGLEVMAVGDMIPQGFYNFSYDGMGSLSFGNGGPCAVPAAEGEFAFIYGDGISTDYSRPYVVVRRTAAALPAKAVSDALYINQTQLFQVNVTLTSVNSVTPSHFLPMSNDEDSGISLWWDADASGAFSNGDMFVPLLEVPVLEGTGDSWKCSLTPDPAFLTAWLSRAKDVTADNRNNFFVCVKTSVDMSYGDQFTVAADFFDPTEPNYDYSYYSEKTNAFGNAVCFASITSDVVSCTSVTNTILAKMTATGQTVDADTNVGMVSIEHFVEQATTENLPYVIQVEFDLFNVQNFDPATMLKPVDKATAVAERGLVLYKDADGDGALDPEVDTAIETTILVDASEADTWHYTLMVDGADCTVSTTDDSLPDLFMTVNTAENLPFNVTFYGKMESNAITYNTGKGSASAAIRTDNLTTTVNSNYQQTAGIVNDTTTPGLLVTAAGSGVSGLQQVTVTRNSKGNLVLAWGSNSVTVKPGDGLSTVTLGADDNRLTLVFDPDKFLAAMGEDWDGSEVAWNVMVNSAVTIRRITPENANTQFQSARAAMSAIIGLDFANSGATDITLTSVTARFTNVNGFATTDLCDLAADETSGVQLWKDADGDGVFNPEADTAMALAGKPAWTNDGTDYIVTLSVSSNNKIESEECDGLYDFFLVVLPSTNANNSVEVDAGDQFTVTINAGDVVLNKTVNKSASVVTGTITIDSLPPKVAENGVEVELNAEGTATESVTITFNEAAFAYGLEDDFSVWTVTDLTEGSAYEVTAVEIPEDGTSVTLTLTADESLTYSADGVEVVADFTINAAIVDLAGNPVELNVSSEEPEPPTPGDD